MVYSTYLWRFWGWFIMVYHCFTNITNGPLVYRFHLGWVCRVWGVRGWRFKQQQWGCKQEPLETSQKMGT